jgi:hypothetical protein
VRDQAISATGTSREQRVSSFHCISEPRSPKMSKGSRPEVVPHLRSDLGHPSNGTRGVRSSHFGYRDFERTEGLLLPLHFRTPKPETPKGSRPEAVPHLRSDLGRPSNGTRGARSSHFGYRDFERTEGLLLPLHFRTPKPEMPKGSRPEVVPHLRSDLGHPSNGTCGTRSSHFGYRDFERTEGLLLPLHFRTLKPEMPKGSRPEVVPHLRSDLGHPSNGTRGVRSSHFGYRDFERTEGLLLPLHFRIAET